MVGYNAFNRLPILTVRGVKDPLTTGEYNTGFLSTAVGIRDLNLKLVEDIHRVEVLSMLHLRNPISWSNRDLWNGSFMAKHSNTFRNRNFTRRILRWQSGGSPVGLCITDLWNRNITSLPICTFREVKCDRPVYVLHYLKQVPNYSHILSMVLSGAFCRMTSLLPQVSSCSLRKFQILNNLLRKRDVRNKKIYWTIQ